MPFEIIKQGTHIDFIGKRRVAAVISAALLLAGIGAAAVNGIRMGIDFAGGTEIQVRFDPGVLVDEGAIRSIVNEVEGVEDASVVRYGEVAENEFLIKFRASLGERGSAVAAVPEPATSGDAEADAAQDVASAPAAADAADDPADGAGGGESAAQTASAPETGASSPQPGTDTGAAVTGGGSLQGAGEDPAGSDKVDRLDRAFGEAFGGHSIERVEFVGPRVGAELRNDGLQALAFASLAILIYIWFRFSSRFAPGAIAAVIHDLSITAAIFVMLGLEFDLRILAAMLAILGYSLNDTIIIYDRIRENMELRTKADLHEVLNLSINQTLSRTILTSSTTLIALFSLLLLGGQVIWPFAFAMILGVVVGTYSSVYIAGATLLWLEERLAKA